MKAVAVAFRMALPRAGSPRPKATGRGTGWRPSGGSFTAASRCGRMRCSIWRTRCCALKAGADEQFLHAATDTETRRPEQHVDVNFTPDADRDPLCDPGT
jgi:hypothetical protein